MLKKVWRSFFVLFDKNKLVFHSSHVSTSYEKNYKKKQFPVAKTYSIKKLRKLCSSFAWFPRKSNLQLLINFILPSILYNKFMFSENSDEKISRKN